MYNVSDGFKSAIESTSRLMSCKAYLNGVEVAVDKILKLDIEDNINNGDYFTIGEVPSKSLSIEMIGVNGVEEGAEIIPHIGVEIALNQFEYVPCGVFYVDSVSINKDKVSATCYDKMLSLDDEYIPSITIAVTLSEIMNDICRQKEIEFEGQLPSVTVNKSIKGYSYREMVGFIASFCGGNAKFNRFGKLVIQRYVKTSKVITPDVCASFEHKDVYSVSAIACKFGDVANTRGDSSANCVNFTNPFVDDTNIDSIFNSLNGLSFSAAALKYKGDPSIDSGDLITVNDIKGNAYTVLVSTQSFSFGGGLSSEVTSTGEGKGANAYKQYKFKNKKTITELNVELGLIQGIISEVQEKQEDTYTKTETETLIEAKAGEISLEVAKAEIDKTLEDYSTTEEMQAEIKVAKDAITNTVKEDFYTKEETNHQITSKGYQTASEVQQLVDQVTYNFNQSGGYNLLLNSRWEYDFFNWNTPHSSIVRIQDATTGLYYCRATMVVGANHGLIQVFKQEKGRTYTVSAQVDIEAGAIAGIEISYTNASGTKLWIGVNTASNPSNYKNGILSFAWTTDVSGDVQVNFYSRGAHGSGVTSGKYLRWRYTQVEQGRTHTGWSPNPYEIYQGQTLINKNGVRVNASNVGTYTQMSADGFFVKKNDGNVLFESTNKIVLYDGKGTSCVAIVNDPSANYGNARVDVRGGINFVHNPNVSVGTNQILLGNDDRSDAYGYHNMSIRCHNSLGFQDNYGYTHMFADTRRGRWIMKGALYQNTQTPPSTFSMNFDGEDKVYNSGYARSQAVDSIMNLKTGVYVDNDGECCSAIYGGYSELITTEYSDEDGNMTTHLNHEALNASLVVTCQEQQKLINVLQQELNEIKEYLKIT